MTMLVKRDILLIYIPIILPLVLRCMPFEIFIREEITLFYVNRLEYEMQIVSLFQFLIMFALRLPSMIEIKTGFI